MMMMIRFGVCANFNPASNLRINLNPEGYNLKLPSSSGTCGPAVAVALSFRAARDLLSLVVPSKRLKRSICGAIKIPMQGGWRMSLWSLGLRRADALFYAPASDCCIYRRPEVSMLSVIHSPLPTWFSSKCMSCESLPLTQLLISDNISSAFACCSIAAVGQSMPIPAFAHTLTQPSVCSAAHMGPSHHLRR